jgi:hypothetical protein
MISSSAIVSWSLVELPQSLDRAVTRLPTIEAQAITDPALARRLGGWVVVPFSTLDGIRTVYALEVFGRFSAGWWSMRSPHL